MSFFLLLLWIWESFFYVKMSIFDALMSSDLTSYSPFKHVPVSFWKTYYLQVFLCLFVQNAASDSFVLSLSRILLTSQVSLSGKGVQKSVSRCSECSLSCGIIASRPFQIEFWKICLSTTEILLFPTQV